MDKLVSVSRKPTALSPSSISLEKKKKLTTLSGLSVWQMIANDNSKQMSNMFYDGFMIWTAQMLLHENNPIWENRLDGYYRIKGGR
jgi:hypothetical protein